MASPITAELMHTHQSLAANPVFERGAEIANSLYTADDDRRGDLRYNFFETVMDHIDCLDALPEGIEEDQLEDLLLGRAVHRSLQMEKARRSVVIAPCETEGF